MALWCRSSRDRVADCDGELQLHTKMILDQMQTVTRLCTIPMMEAACDGDEMNIFVVQSVSGLLASPTSWTEVRVRPPKRMQEYESTTQKDVPSALKAVSLRNE